MCLGDIAKITNCILHADTVEIVDLATRENSRDNLVLLGCCQYEDCVRRWFLKCFEKGVKSCLRKHMYLVNDVNLVLANLWRYAYLLIE